MLIFVFSGNVGFRESFFFQIYILEYFLSENFVLVSLYMSGKGFILLVYIEFEIVGQW